MNFRDILEEWELHGGSAIFDKDSLDADEPADPRAEARRIAALKPEEVLDLHGMTVTAAEEALEAFLAEASRRGLEKVLVIHGKGNHSKGEPVLGKVARRVIEANPWTGRYGVAGRSEGGSGALWVSLRRESKKFISRDR